MVTTRPCPQCNHANSTRARFCSNCGRPMGEAPRAATRTPSKMVAKPVEAAGMPQPVVQQRVEKALGTVIGVLQGSIGAVHISPMAGNEGGRTPRDQIHAPPDDYIPRRAVEDRLRSLLTATPGRLNVIGLHGLPGSGKSSVGRKVAGDLAAEFPDGRLWIDVENHSEIHLLWCMIDPFEQPPERSPFRDESQYRAVMNRAIGKQRVLIVFNRVGLGSMERVRRSLPAQTADVSVLVISDAPLPDLIDPANSVALPEMTPDEACQLFRSIWRDAYRSTTDDTVRDLASEFNFLPTQIAVVARDILNHQISPSEYLTETRAQKSMRTFISSTAGGFQTVYENLPDQGRRALPFIGVMGASPWQSLALAAVSQLPHDDVEVALRQLQRVGFVNRTPDGRFACSPAARDFALSSLHELGGDALVRSARTVLAYQTLRASEEITLLRRLSLLKDWLADETRKKLFQAALRESFLPPAGQKAHGDTGTLTTTPGLGDYDIIQDTFEDVVLANSEYLDRWQHWINSSLCIDQAHNLEEALRWAIQQEDWALVRNFYNISLGVYVPKLAAQGEIGRRASVTTTGFRFGALRSMSLSHVFLESTLYGVRIIRPELTHCELIGAYWGGVRLHRPTLVDVDLVNAALPGLVVQDGMLTDVDFRSADLRGAVFYNCHFMRVNFRGADMRQVRLLSCTGSDIDLRSARLEGVGFHNCTFSRVVYYKADAERLPLRSETTQLN